MTNSQPSPLWQWLMKIGLLIWIFLCLLVYMLLYRSPEFISLSWRLGLAGWMTWARDWLIPFFYAPYLG